MSDIYLLEAVHLSAVKTQRQILLSPWQNPSMLQDNSKFEKDGLGNCRTNTKFISLKFKYSLRSRSFSLFAINMSSPLNPRIFQ